MTLRVRATSAALRAIPTARRPISAKSSRTAAGSGRPSSSDLGDVQGEVAHPFQVACARIAATTARRSPATGAWKSSASLAISSTRARRASIAASPVITWCASRSRPSSSARGGLLHGGRRGRGHPAQQRAELGELLGQRLGGHRLHRERAGHLPGHDVDDPAGDGDGVVGVALVEAGEQGDVDGGPDAVAPVAVHEHGEHVPVQVVHGVVVGAPARPPSRGRGCG